MNNQSQVPPFTLYGLIGCPHCAEAEAYLRARNLPVNLVVSNEDPIADAGVKAVLGSPMYPVLIYRPTSAILTGFDEGKYSEVANDYFKRLSAGSANVFGSGLQPQPQAPVETPAPSAPNGAN